MKIDSLKDAKLQAELHGRPTPQAEQYITQHCAPEEMLEYVEFVGQGRIPAIEAALMKKDEQKALIDYCRVIKEPIKEIEDYIARRGDVTAAAEYVNAIGTFRHEFMARLLAAGNLSLISEFFRRINMRSAEFEKLLVLRDHVSAMLTYVGALDTRVPRFERHLDAHGHWEALLSYAESVDARVPVLERWLTEECDDPELVLKYAVNVLRERHHGLEQRLVALNATPTQLIKYVEFVAQARVLAFEPIFAQMTEYDRQWYAQYVDPTDAVLAFSPQVAAELMKSEDQDESPKSCPRCGQSTD